MASSLGESFCSRILDVGRAGGRASEPVCGCAGVQGGIGRWSLGVIWYDSANGISTIGSQQQGRLNVKDREAVAL